MDFGSERYYYVREAGVVYRGEYARGTSAIEAYPFRSGKYHQPFMKFKMK